MSLLLPSKACEMGGALLDNERRAGFYSAADHLCHFVNALDSSGMSGAEVRSAIYAECIGMRPAAPEIAVILTASGIPILVDESDHDWLSQLTWTVTQTGNKAYAVARLPCGRSEYMHRLILGLGMSDELVGDHINGCTVDNRRKNLRRATFALNAHNTVRRRTNLTGHRGVSLHRATGRYQARLRCDGKVTSLGYFDTADEAAVAYATARALRSAEMEKKNVAA